jgi:hypothetical protein
MPSPRVAFLGIGLMGASMASNIARADLPITVWEPHTGEGPSIDGSGRSGGEHRCRGGGGCGRGLHHRYQRRGG